MVYSLPDPEAKYVHCFIYIKSCSCVVKTVYNLKVENKQILKYQFSCRNAISLEEIVHNTIRTDGRESLQWVPYSLHD